MGRLPHFTTERNLEQFATLVADKGYDDQTYRDGLRARGKRPLIKHREFKPQDKAANARMDARVYHRRSLVETVISALKRKYGAAVSSRVWWRQFREMVVMCLVYNVERAVKLGVTLLALLLAKLLYFLPSRISTEPINAIDCYAVLTVSMNMRTMVRSTRLCIHTDDDAKEATDLRHAGLLDKEPKA